MKQKLWQFSLKKIWKNLEFLSVICQSFGSTPCLPFFLSHRLPSFASSFDPWPKKPDHCQTNPMWFWLCHPAGWKIALARHFYNFPCQPYSFPLLASGHVGWRGRKQFQPWKDPFWLCFCCRSLVVILDQDFFFGVDVRFRYSGRWGDFTEFCNSLLFITILLKLRMEFVVTNHKFVDNKFLRNLIFEIKSNYLIMQGHISIPLCYSFFLFF